MKKNLVVLLTAMAVAASMFVGCGSAETTVTEEVVEDADVEEAEVEEAEVEETEAVEGEMVSDDTFAALQESYAAMVEAHNAVVEYYNSDEVEADADIEATLNEAADIINEMGEINQEDMTEEDALTLNQAMLDILDTLSIVLDAM